MNAHKHRIKAPRALLVAGCLAALAGPSAAAATSGAGAPWVDPPLRHTIAQAPAPYKSDAFAGGLVQPAVTPDSGGAKLDHRGLNASSHHFYLGSTFVTDTQSSARDTAERPYALPAGFKTDVQSSARGTAEHPYALPADFKTDVQSSPPSTATSTSPGTVVREIRSIASDDGQTLAIALGAVALGIAISGSGYAVIRVQRMQRRVLGSSS
jgi:hypothetical protein